MNNTRPEDTLPIVLPSTLQSNVLSTKQRAKLFAALGDPTRLRIIENLAAQPEASGSRLAKQLNISLALFCHHSKILIASGLISARKQGQTKFLSLNQALLQTCCASLCQQNLPNQE